MKLSNEKGHLIHRQGGVGEKAPNILEIFKGWNKFATEQILAGWAGVFAGKILSGWASFCFSKDSGSFLLEGDS